MKKERTYEQLLVENKALKQRIAYLERMLYGSKSDRVKKQPEDDGQLSLFEDLFKEAVEEKAAEVEKVANEIEAVAHSRPAGQEQEGLRLAIPRQPPAKPRALLPLP